MEKKQLRMDFNTTGLKQFRLTLPNPKAALDDTAIRPVAEQLISGRVFRKGDPITELTAATMVTVTEDKLI